MSIQLTSQQLARLLDDDDSKVVALSGKWGTGKSFIWEQLQRESKNTKVTGALYTSLFGLSSLDQVKLKLIQSAAPTLEKSPTLLAGAKQFVQSSVKVLEGMHPSFGAINDLGLLFAPAVLREKLIVLDDIERKHADLDIDELLGFIDEFTQRFGARFLLILNSDNLNQRETWELMREKVVDEELRLTTTCEEAFEIAINLTPSPWARQIAQAAEKCGLTNIRVVRKVIKAVNRIIGQRDHVSDAVLMRVVPSTVLLAAIHYKGIENGPDLSFVLSFNQSTENWQRFLTPQEGAQTDEESDKERHQAQWRNFINGLSIHSCDEFELLVVEFLQSGLFDVSKVSALIDGYESEHEAMSAHYAVNIFLQKCFWEHDTTEYQLLLEAQTLAEKVHLVDAPTVTAFHDQLRELTGGSPLADEVIARWLQNFKPQANTDNFLSRMFRRGIHPSIEAELHKIEEEQQADMSVFEACKDIATSSGWNTRQEIALKVATVEAFESTIRTVPASDLQMFMAKMLDFTAQGDRYEQYFGSAMANFVEACRRIVADPTVPRLTKILNHLFNEAKLSELLSDAR
ncbi:P-loop NTPase fold protein [Eoetvoesiella caeni]